MRIIVNGDPQDLAATTLAEALTELGHGEAKVATALNGDFVPATGRAARALAEGDRLEVLSPRQGG